MRRLVPPLVVLLILTTMAACGGGGGDERTVLIDYTSDEFSSFALANFPDKVTIRQGQTVVFRQTWTGEPHTVTGGSVVNQVLAKTSAWLDFFGAFEDLAGSGADIPDPENPGDTTIAEFARALRKTKDGKAVDRAYVALRGQVPELLDLDADGAKPFADLVKVVDEKSDSAFEGLQFAGDDDGNLTQNLGQPCYLRTGDVPEDPQTACAKPNQKQPAFDGKHSVYNSGILPYRGQGGNTYKVKFADDVTPGTYKFYCAVHGPGQMSTIVVKPRGTKVPSAAAVAREAQAQRKKLLAPVEKVHRDAVARGRITIQGKTIKGPFAGVFDPSVDHVGANEFIPRRRTVKVNEPITWKMMGADHTISFDVPPYFPIVNFSRDGVRFNSKIKPAAGGAVAEPPRPGDSDEDEDEPGIRAVDGGTYDGVGFWSSGLIGGGGPYVEYTMRISKPGTYAYACLVHPPMIGQIVVT